GLEGPLEGRRVGRRGGSAGRSVHGLPLGGGGSAGRSVHGLPLGGSGAPQRDGEARRGDPPEGAEGHGATPSQGVVRGTDRGVPCLKWMLSRKAPKTLPPGSFDSSLVQNAFEASWSRRNTRSASSRSLVVSNAARSGSSFQPMLRSHLSTAARTASMRGD